MRAYLDRKFLCSVETDVAGFFWYLCNFQSRSDFTVYDFHSVR